MTLQHTADLMRTLFKRPHRSKAQRYPCIPGSFRVSDSVLLRDDSDLGRLAAEEWCTMQCRGRACRRSPRPDGPIYFDFQRRRDATLFKLWHG